MVNPNEGLHNEARAGNGGNNNNDDNNNGQYAQGAQPPRWGSKTCVAKTLLEEDIKSRRIEGWLPMRVWESRPEYQLYPLKNFRSNLNRLRQTVVKQEFAASSKLAG